MVTWSPFKPQWCRFWLSPALLTIRLTLRRKGLPVTLLFGILTENSGSVPIVVLNAVFYKCMKIRIARDPLTMCKFFFLSPKHQKQKLKTPPHPSFLYVSCVFFLVEPENPFLWYLRNRGHDLDFFLIFSPIFSFVPAYVVPPWVHNSGSFFSFSFPSLCFNILVLFGSCPMRNCSKDQNLLPAFFHFPPFATTCTLFL